MPLTPTDIADELARSTFWPGWDLRFEVDPLEGPCLWIVATTPDLTHAGESVTLNIRSLIPPASDLAGFRRWLLWRLALVGIHEVCEGYRVDGVPVSDPHRDRMPPPRLGRQGDLKAGRTVLPITVIPALTPQGGAMSQGTKSTRGGNGGNSGPADVLSKRQVVDIRTENRWTV